MGKGSKPTEKDVRKLKAATGSRARGSSGGASDASSCLFAFDVTVDLAASLAPSVSAGSIAHIIPTADAVLSVVVNGKVLGAYAGKNASTVLRCIGEGYEYVGLVKSLSNGRAIFAFKGVGGDDAAAGI